MGTMPFPVQHFPMCIATFGNSSCEFEKYKFTGEKKKDLIFDNY